MPEIHAVLTGDLVKSRDFDPEIIDRAMTALEAAAGAFGRARGFGPRFTRSRGDGWQIFVPNPADVLDICLFLRARLASDRSLPATRVSVGIGPVDGPPNDDLSTASGPAFFLSGDQLETMPRKRRMVVAGGEDAFDAWRAAIFELVEWISGSWTATQAEAVALALLSEANNAELARSLSITRQAFEARLAGAGFPALSGARAAFRAHDYDTEVAR